MTSSKVILYKRFSTELFPGSQRKSNEIKRKSIFLIPLPTLFKAKKSNQDSKN